VGTLPGNPGSGGSRRADLPGTGITSTRSPWTASSSLPPSRRIRKRSWTWGRGRVGTLCLVAAELALTKPRNLGHVSPQGPRARLQGCLPLTNGAETLPTRTPRPKVRPALPSVIGAPADGGARLEVIGTDISPIQPVWVPPNLRFEIDDCTLDWTWSPDTFDFVHARQLFGAIADWPALYGQAFRVLKPGGYLESFESSVDIKSDDGSIQEGDILYRCVPPRRCFPCGSA